MPLFVYIFVVIMVFLAITALVLTLRDAYISSLDRRIDLALTRLQRSIDEDNNRRSRERTIEHNIKRHFDNFKMNPPPDPRIQ